MTKQLSQKEIDEILTNYIVYFAKENQDFSRYHDVEKLYDILSQNEIVYHYASDSDPVWSYAPLEGDIAPSFHGAAAEAGNEMLYDMVNHSVTYPHEESHEEEE